MQSTNEISVKRVSAFGNGIVVFGLVLLLLAGLWAANRLMQQKGQDPEEAAAVKRYETMKLVQANEAAKLAFKELEPGKKVQVPPQVAFPIVGKQLVEKQEYVEEKPEFLVPVAAPAAK